MEKRAEKNALPKSRAEKKNFFAENKFFFGSFLILFFYNFAVVNNFTLPAVDGERYSFHVVDFSFGFCSKFLQGAFFRLFVKEPTEAKVTVYNLILLTVLFLLVSFFINVISKKISEEYHTAFAVLLAFFLTGPLTFSIFSYRLGMPDFLWIFLTALFFLCFRFEKLRFMIPFLCVAGVMVHYGFMISYVLLFAVIVLYEMTLTENANDRKRLWLLFFAMAVCTVGTFLFFFVCDKRNLVYSEEEFHAVLASYGVTNHRVLDYYLYSDISQYGYSSMEELVPTLIDTSQNGFIALVGRLCNYFIVQFYVYCVSGIGRLALKLFGSLLLLSPVLLLLYQTIRFSRSRTGKRAADKMAYFCIYALFPGTVLFSVLFSTDGARWIAHAAIELFTVVFYILFRENESVIAYVKKKFEKSGKIFWLLYFLLYSVVVIDPYS